MKRILVPTDFSDNAYNALFYATRFFKGQACKFYVLNTFEVHTPVLTSRMNTEKGDSLYRKLSKKSKEKLTETFHSITRDTDDLNHSFETISVSKNLSDTINKAIEKYDIDLVVMGTKGCSGTKEIFMGSNTVNVIKKIKNCSVLAVPDEYDFDPIKEIAFPTDFRRFYLEEELKPLITIASLFNSNIRIFHINEEEKLDEVQQYNFSALKKYLKDFECSVHWINKDSKKVDLIQGFIQEMNIDLLAMVYYSHSFMENIVKEPVIKKIGFNPTVPFLVISDAS